MLQQYRKLYLHHFHRAVGRVVRAVGSFSSVFRNVLGAGFARICEARLPMLIESAGSQYRKVVPSMVLGLGFALVSMSVNAISPAGTVIENTASASFDLGNASLASSSNKVSVTTVLSPSAIRLLQYSPASAVLNEETPSECRSGSGGAFVVSANPVVAVTASGSLTLNPANTVGLQDATFFHSNDAAFIHVDDADQNRDAGVAEKVVVRVSSSLGDQEDVLLAETDVNTGIFIGYIQTSVTPMTIFNCLLTVSPDSSLVATYTDSFDGSDTVSAATLVDPFGIVFDSRTGNPVNGMVIRLVDVATGLPAVPGTQIFGDDGVSAYPNTIVSGSSATDSGGNVVIFSAGGFRFPLLAPGRYRLELIATPGYLAPSQTPIVDLQNLPGAPYALLADASFGQAFDLNPGVILHVDIPVDPVSVQLVVEKTASKSDVAVGDFVQYRVDVQNTDDISTAPGVMIDDALPQGFHYQPGSVRLDGLPLVDPVIAADGRSLRFAAHALLPGGRLSLTYVTEVTAGAVIGQAINRARASDQLGSTSNVAQAVVKVRDEFMREHVTIVGRVIVGNCPELQGSLGQSQIRLQAVRQQNDNLDYQVELGVEAVAVSNYRAVVQLPEGIRYLPGSAQLDGLSISDPVVQGTQLLFQLGHVDEIWGTDWSHRLQFVAEVIAGRKVDVLKTQVTGWLDTPYQRDQKTASAEAVLSAQSVADVVAVTKADSGMLQQVVVGHLQQYEAARVGTDLPGLEKARLLLENGTYAVTDREGKYHFEGVSPGTHVVQLDETSLPADMQVQVCEENTRFAGKAYSRFVDVQGGTLWRVDFHLRQKPPIVSDVNLQMQSVLLADGVAVSIDQRGGAVALSNYRLTVLLPDGLRYVAGSSQLDGRKIAEPEVNDSVLVYRLGDKPGNWRERISFQAAFTDQTAGMLSVKAFSIFDTAQKQGVKVPVVENTLRKQDDHFGNRQFVFQPRYATFRTELSDADKAEIRNFIENLDVISIEQIRVIGHTDNVRIKKTNQHLFKDNYALSRGRAQVVADYIRELLHMSQQDVVAIGKGPDEPIASNATDEGRAKNRRTEISISAAQRTGVGVVALVKEWSELAQVNVSGRALAAAQVSRVMPPKIIKPMIKDYDLAWLNAAEPGVEWLFPQADFMPSIPAASVAIKHLPNQVIEARIHGEKLNPLFFFGTEKSAAGTVARSYWQGIQLEEGPNELVFTVYDENKQRVTEFARTVHYSGLPVRAELVKEYSWLVADGSVPPVLAVRFFDKWGKPARPGLIGAYSVSEPYFSKEFIDATKDNPLTGLERKSPQYEVGDHGIALIELEPTSQSGKVRLSFVLGEQKHQQEIEAWLKPSQRDWVVVGVADVMAGSRAVGGNQADAASAGHEDDYYHDGKVAMFAKGTFKEDWLVTAAYDTSKDKQAVGNSLFQTIDPDTFFDLYGDKTEQYYEAPSAEKLYAKIERDEFYAMYGDYSTGLNEGELSRFNRSVTGLKSEYHGDRFELNSFATQTAQRFARDELQGNGTSGLYRLSQSGIVMNSEVVKIETRDRFHSQDIVTSRSLRRHFDYEIDYQDGTLYFKAPVASRDVAFNPNMIVVDYEVEAGIEGELSGGGRGAVRLLDGRMVLGLSAIHDDAFQVQGDLVATDMKFAVSDHAEVRLEFASTDVVDAGTPRSGDAYLAEYRHFSDALQGRVYVREQQEGFGLGQQAGSETATRKYGIDGSYRVNESLRIGSEVSHEDNLATGAQRDMAEFDVGFIRGGTTLTSGFRSALDEQGTGDRYESELFLLGMTQNFNQNRMAFRFNNEIALGGTDRNSAYPTRHILGFDYLWRPGVNFFAEHEITDGDRQDSSTSRLGVRTSPWARAQLGASLEEQQVDEFGPRMFSTLGLTQGFQINSRWSADLGLDRVKTLREPGDVPFNINVPPASGTLIEDFSAVSIGASYRGGVSAFVSRFEIRHSEREDKQGVYVGWYRDQSEGIGYSVKLQMFDSLFATGEKADAANARFSLSYRPVESRWIHLNRLDYKLDARTDFLGIETRGRKIIDNWKSNYLLNRSNQFAFSYGVKYVLDHFDVEEYSGVTQLFGVEYRHDFNKRWDFGVHGSVLSSRNASNSLESYGVDVGLTLIENVWLSIGYNFDGFAEDDFSLSEYTAKGFFVKLRMKFDQHSFHDIFAKQSSANDVVAVPQP